MGEGPQASTPSARLPAPLRHQGQGVPGSRRAEPCLQEWPQPSLPTPFPTPPSHRDPHPYPALCFLDLSEMPSRAMSLLKTMIPMSIFTWGPAKQGEGDMVTGCAPGRESPRWELECREG